MSHNPTRPLSDTLFIQEFRDYARSRGDVPYEYEDIHNCACCQFLRDTGRASDPSVGPYDWEDAALPFGSRVSHSISPELNRALVKWNGRTFAALADRLDTLIANDPGVVGEGR